MIRSGQRRRRADRRAKPLDRPVAGQHEMIAVVDHQPELRIAVRAASPARLRRRIGDTHLRARFDQAHGRRQPRQSRAGNRRPREAQCVTSSRASVHSSAGLLTFTGARGGAQPRASIRRSSFE